jgi:hypothetical protein
MNWQYLNRQEKTIGRRNIWRAHVICHVNPKQVDFVSPPYSRVSGSSEKSPPDIYPPGYRDLLPHAHSFVKGPAVINTHTRERLRRSKDFSQVRRVLCVKDVASRVQLWCVVYNTVMILVRACRRREVLECSPCTLRESGSLRG